MVTDKFGGSPAAQISEIRSAVRRSKGDRVYIVELSTRRRAGARRDNSRDNNSENFSSTFRVCKMVHDNGREERAWEANRRERVVECRFAWAPFHRAVVVKYVAIYTGDWRHWRLGSKRVRPSLTPAFSPFLALSSSGLPNSRPYMIVLSSNPCASRSGLPDQKKYSGNPRICLSDAKSKPLPAPLSLFFKFVYYSFFLFFFAPHSIDEYPISWKKLTRSPLCKNHHLAKFINLTLYGILFTLIRI